MLYKFVLVPTPILHANFHENPLTTFGILINFNDNWVSGSPPKSFSVHFLTMSAYPHILKRKKIQKKKKKKLIGSEGHHQCYINWSSAPHPSYI